MIMEGISQRVTPIVKCMVLLLLVFTAKVLTSRTQEGQDSKNSIHQSKPSHYVRTFTKYHHIRSHEWPSTTDNHKHVINKRSVNIQKENELIYSGLDIPNSNYADTEKQKKAISTNDGKNGISEEKKYKVKAAMVVTDPPKVFTPGISCLYKIHSVALSVTPSYDDEINSEQMVENESFDTPGKITETTLPSGEVVQVEQCTEPRASCYILWRQGDGEDVTVLGQGCWRAAAGAACGHCTRVTPRLPGTRFCCCATTHCNAHFLSMREETVTPKAESTIDSKTQQVNYTNIAAAAILAAIAILVIALAFNKIYCKRAEAAKEELSDGMDLEKGDALGLGSDALATGLTCVDNLTLIEHIGQGKFGSVWRGALGGGAAPVAVKLYASAAAWRRERAVYAMPQLRHHNILKYYGSDTRPCLAGGARSRLIVVELCAESLRQRLARAPLHCRQMALLAHGLSAAVAHLHSSSPSKPCIVHRDINSSNVLVTAEGEARLADLGLAQPRGLTDDTRISEAGTLRYLAPEALEGALDLQGARAALCAVDVYALALVLWEMLWRASGRDAQLPYAHRGLAAHASHQAMQNLVCRNKVRPPLPSPRAPCLGAEARALAALAATCEECWDHDAEARLTAVCVEERMSEMRQMLSAPAPVIHDNRLHPETQAPESDKNSNCIQNSSTTQNQNQNPQNCDVRTPLLYTHPHIGRNACVERNTHTETHTVELIHKSLKDIHITQELSPRVDNEEQCLSVARDNPNRVQHQDRSDRPYQRPLEYVPNDVNIENRQFNNFNQEVKVEKPKWGLKRLFERKKNTEVKLQQDGMRTSLIKETNMYRPSDLVINQRIYNEPQCLSPPNRTLSPTMMRESDTNRDNNVFAFKEIPNEDKRQVYAVIVPKAKPGSTTSDSTKASMSSQSLYKTGNSESEDSTIKKRLSIDNRVISAASNIGRSSRASINLELQYIDNSPFDFVSDCSSSEDENLLLLSENGLKITMQPMPKEKDVLKESQIKDFTHNRCNKYTNFDNERYSQDKENLTNFTVDNPVYLAAINGEINTEPKPSKLCIKRQHSLEQVSEIFSSSSDVHLQNPAGRVKTPGDLPMSVRKARREKLQKGRSSDTNRLSLYDDRMMFGNSL